jgi:hypothetical protein
MITALIPFLGPVLGSKWGKLAIEVGFVVLLALGIRAYYINEGKRQGKDEASQTQQQDLNKSRQQDHQELQGVLDKANASLATAEQHRNAADATLLQVAGVLADLAKKQGAGQAAVARLSDSELHPYIVGQLGLRAKGDNTPGYTAAEERSLSECVTQYPICKQQRDAQGQQVTAQQDKTQSADDAAAAEQRIAGATQAFSDKVDDLFNRLYNLHPPRYRSAKCLWLWKCGAKTIAPPAEAKP